MDNNYHEETNANNNKIAKYTKIQIKWTIAAILIMPILAVYLPLPVWAVLFSLFCGVIFYYHNQIKDYHQRNSNIFQKANPDPTQVVYQQEFQNSNYTSQVEKSQFGYIFDPNTQKSQEILVSDEVKDSINKGIGKIKHKEFLYKNWNLQSIDSMDSKNIFNFFGPPGTGKTISAKEVAKILNKKLFVVKYDQVESKMVGDTEKNITSVFQFAKKHDAIIFLDEADSLLSQRVEASTANGQYLNASKNVFMQELDQFNGIMILTTNLFKSFDEAILRRINQHVKFELPDKETRSKLFRSHIPKEVNLNTNVNFEKLGDVSAGLSGGDIKNITCEAMNQSIIEADRNGDITKACLGENHLMSEIKRVKKTKDEYFGKKESKVIGINSTSEN